MLALGLALPAYLQTNGDFVPTSFRYQPEPSERVALELMLARSAPLFVEAELTLRGDPGPAFVYFDLNGERVHEASVNTRHLMEWVRFPVASQNTRSGDNVLLVTASGPAGEGPLQIAISARIHNYYGINSSFPRAYVVLDEAFGLWLRERAPISHAMRFAGLVVLCIALAWVARRVPGATASAFVLVSAALAFGVATPFHLWFPPESMLLLLVVPPGLLFVVDRARRGARAKGLVRGLAIAAITLALAEVSFRALHAVSPVFLFESDSYDRFRGRPNAPHFGGRLNALGLDDRDHPETKPEGGYRIAALGDSFAFGVVPYQDNFLTLLERRLSERAGREVEVLNFGIPGTTPEDYRAVFRREAVRYAPDLVLVCFFIGNDFETAERPGAHSYVLSLLRFLWRVGGAPDGTLGVSEPAAYVDHAPTMSEERFLAIETERAWIYESGRALEPALERAVEVLKQIDADARRADAGLVVVVIPDEVQVDERLQAQVAASRGRLPEELDFELPNELLMHALNEAGIPGLDLLPAFSSHSSDARLYKPRDTHWNLAGNRLAADEIFDFLWPLSEPER